MSFRERLYLSTTAPDAPALAREHGLGLEIAEYCTASHMDREFASVDPAVRGAMAGVERFTLHAPFNELSPAAIDPLVRELTVRRYRQAVALAGTYGIRKIVVHSGYIPRIYFPSWFVGESVPFWQEFLRSVPENVTLCLENVMEARPGLLEEIVRGVDDPRFRLCLDVGHAACQGPESAGVEEWIETLSPYIAHVHLHCNDGRSDRHLPLGQGVPDMERVLPLLAERCPAATMTIENIRAGNSVRWLLERKYL